MDTNVKEKENIDVTSIIEAPDVKSDTEIARLNHEAALASYPDDVKKEVLALADAIDVTQFEKVMAYGETPLLRSFEEAGTILKNEEGSDYDQTVINQVVDLANKAKESNKELNLALEKPNFLEGLLLKLSRSRSNKRKDKITTKAKTCYRVLVSLRDSCDSWMNMLKEGMGQITLSNANDKMNCSELEKYLVAGYIAKERIAKQLEDAKKEYEVSLVQEAEDKYNSIKEGSEIFDVVLLNLEKSRAAFKISMGQLMLEERTNKNLQIAINTQKSSTTNLTGLQLRNAILEAKNREAMEGQKSLIKLNDDLMQMVSSNAVLTAEQSEEVLRNGVYTVEAAVTAAKTVIDGCNSIIKEREKNSSKIMQDMDKLETIINDLEPYINSVKGNGNVTKISAKSNTSNSVSTTNSGSGLKF